MEKHGDHVHWSSSMNVSQKRCVMHLANKVKEEVKPFTEIRWKKFLECARKWNVHDCAEADLAREEAAKLGIKLDDLEPIDVSEENNIQSALIPANIGFHEKCYRYFCDVNKIKRKKSTAG